VKLIFFIRKHWCFCCVYRFA